MNAITVTTSILINAPCESVFSAATTGISYWWGEPYLENSDTEDVILEPKIGGRFYERWSNNDNLEEGALIGTVIAIKKPELLRIQGVFRAREHYRFGAVSMNFNRHGDDTLVTFVHQIIGEGDSDMEAGYISKWEDLIRRLKTFVETHRGKGLRFDPTSNV